MSTQQHQPRPSGQHQPDQEVRAVASTRAAAARDAYDAVLDEIDAVLEKDAEAFVRGFVQKGGQ